MSEHEQIIELITKQTRVLLQNHWADINDFRNGEASIKVSLYHDIGYESQKPIIETAISFNKRIKDSIIGRLDTDQMPLDFSAPIIEPVKRGRGRPKKNVLETALKAGPHPDPEDAA